MKTLPVLTFFCLAFVADFAFAQNALYAPGNVKAEKDLRAPLEPPEQPADAEVSFEDGVEQSTWLVEPDVTLAYSAVGQGRPVLVVHGGPGVPYANPWKGVQGLSDDYKFYFYHQRGCGESSRPVDKFESPNFFENMMVLDKALGIGAQVADIERARRILGEEKLLLVGHSYGGFLAALYAAEFPEHVEKLVLVAPAGLLQLPNPEVDMFSLFNARLEGEQLAEFQQALAAHMNFGTLFTKSEEQLAAENHEFGEAMTKAMGETMPPGAEEVRNGGWMVQGQYFAMGMQHDYRDGLKDAKVPVLILHGEQDEFTLPGAKTYVEAFPQAEFHIIKPAESAHVGHFPFDAEPEAFGQKLREFLDSETTGGTK